MKPIIINKQSFLIRIIQHCAWIGFPPAARFTSNHLGWSEEYTDTCSFVSLVLGCLLFLPISYLFVALGIIGVLFLAPYSVYVGSMDFVHSPEFYAGLGIAGGYLKFIAGLATVSWFVGAALLVVFAFLGAVAIIFAFNFVGIGIVNRFRKARREREPQSPSVVSELFQSLKNKTCKPIKIE